MKFQKEWYVQADLKLLKIRKEFIDWSMDYGLEMGALNRDRGTVLDMFDRFSAIAHTSIAKCDDELERLEKRTKDPRFGRCQHCTDDLVDVGDIKDDSFRSVRSQDLIFCLECTLRNLHRSWTELQIRLDRMNEQRKIDKKDPITLDKETPELEQMLKDIKIIFGLGDRDITLLGALYDEWKKRTEGD